LRDNLARQVHDGRTLAVFAALGDKALAEMAGVIAPMISAWYLAPLDVERGADLEALQTALAGACPTAASSSYADVTQAYRAACADAADADRVVVFGSFYTVGAIMRAEKLS
jgi:dihydrofolate synthase/folylpolyglutamate synthase